MGRKRQWALTLVAVSLFRIGHPGLQGHPPNRRHSDQEHAETSKEQADKQHWRNDHPDLHHSLFGLPAKSIRGAGWQLLLDDDQLPSKTLASKPPPGQSGSPDLRNLILVNALFERDVARSGGLWALTSRFKTAKRQYGIDLNGNEYRFGRDKR